MGSRDKDVRETVTALSEAMTDLVATVAALTAVLHNDDDPPPNEETSERLVTPL